MNELFIRNIEIEWDKIDKYSYLNQIDALHSIQTLTFDSPITFFVGENGTGKSTLLEAIAIAHGFNPEGGSKNYNFSTKDTHSELCSAIKIVRGSKKESWGYFLRAESFYNVATYEEQVCAGSNVQSKKYHEKSHGESFIEVAFDNMTDGGLYIFDEPEAALSSERQLSLLIQIYQSAKEGSQFIIASHSPILLGIPNAQIYSFDNGTIQECNYEETESYKITELFLNHRENFLKKLLD